MREELLRDLIRLRDEFRLRIHLGAMDARDAWRSLEPLVAAVERDLADAGEDAIARAALVVASMRRFIHPPVDAAL